MTLPNQFQRYLNDPDYEVVKDKFGNVIQIKQKATTEGGHSYSPHVLNVDKTGHIIEQHYGTYQHKQPGMNITKSYVVKKNEYDPSGVRTGQSVEQKWQEGESSPDVMQVQEYRDGEYVRGSRKAWTSAGGKTKTGPRGKGEAYYDAKRKFQKDPRYLDQRTGKTYTSREALRRASDYTGGRPIPVSSSQGVEINTLNPYQRRDLMEHQKATIAQNIPLYERQRAKEQLKEQIQAEIKETGYTATNTSGMLMGSGHTTPSKDKLKTWGVSEDTYAEQQRYYEKEYRESSPVRASIFIPLETGQKWLEEKTKKWTLGGYADVGAGFTGTLLGLTKAVSHPVQTVSALARPKEVLLGLKEHIATKSPAYLVGEVGAFYSVNKVLGFSAKKIESKLTTTKGKLIGDVDIVGSQKGLGKPMTESAGGLAKVRVWKEIKVPKVKVTKGTRLTPKQYADHLIKQRRLVYTEPKGKFIHLKQVKSKWYKVGGKAVTEKGKISKITIARDFPAGKTSLLKHELIHIKHPHFPEPFVKFLTKYGYKKGFRITPDRVTVTTKPFKFGTKTYNVGVTSEKIIKPNTGTYTYRTKAMVKGNKNLDIFVGAGHGKIKMTGLAQKSTKSSYVKQGGLTYKLDTPVTTSKGWVYNVAGEEHGALVLFQRTKGLKPVKTPRVTTVSRTGVGGRLWEAHYPKYKITHTGNKFVTDYVGYKGKAFADYTITGRKMYVSPKIKGTTAEATTQVQYKLVGAKLPSGDIWKVRTGTGVVESKIYPKITPKGEMIPVFNAAEGKVLFVPKQELSLLEGGVGKGSVLSKMMLSKKGQSQLFLVQPKTKVLLPPTANVMKTLTTVKPPVSILQTAEKASKLSYLAKDYSVLGGTMVGVGLLGRQKPVSVAQIIEKENVLELKPLQKPFQIPLSEPVLKPIQKPVQKPLQKPIQKITQKPIQKIVQKPVVKPIQKPFDTPLPFIPEVPPTKTPPFFFLASSVKIRRRTYQPIKKTTAKAGYSHTLWGMELPRRKATRRFVDTSFTGLELRPRLKGLKLLKTEPKKKKKKKSRTFFEEFTTESTLLTPTDRGFIGI